MYLTMILMCLYSHFFHQQLRKVAHEGCINRIRAMQQNPHICASWSDSGHVQVRLDLYSLILELVLVSCNASRMIACTFEFIYFCRESVNSISFLFHAKFPMLLD